MHPDVYLQAEVMPSVEHLLAAADIQVSHSLNLVKNTLMIPCHGCPSASPMPWSRLMFIFNCFHVSG